jgi:hypothetical protein
MQPYCRIFRSFLRSVEGLGPPILHQLRRFRDTFCPQPPTLIGCSRGTGRCVEWAFPAPPRSFQRKTCGTAAQNLWKSVPVRQRARGQPSQPAVRPNRPTNLDAIPKLPKASERFPAASELRCASDQSVAQRCFFGCPVLAPCARAGLLPSVSAATPVSGCRTLRF